MRLIFDAESVLQEEWEEKLLHAAKVCLANEGITDHAEISVSFVDEEEIRRLNRTYRDTDRVTDVLSFPMFERDEVAMMSERVESELAENPESGIYLALGDVVICAAQAGRQAEEYGHSYDREVVYLFVHSVLHLLGYDHIEEEDKSMMRAQEEIVMRELGLPRTAEASDEMPGEIIKSNHFLQLTAKGQTKEEVYRELIDLARLSLKNAYAPFSGYQVGAALLTGGNFIFTGVNIENSSFGATICAERTAFAKAISYGIREFKAIAVVSSEGGVWPCGICRQFMKEFCDDHFEIITTDENGAVRQYTMAEILPEGFRL